MKFSPHFTPQINKNSIIVSFNLPQRESKSTMFTQGLDLLFDIFECGNSSTSATTLRSFGKYAHVTAAERRVEEQPAALK